MKKIIFGHRYLKFRGLKIPKYATLLEVFEKESLSPAFVKYDTAYVVKGATGKNVFHAPVNLDGEVIVLLFQDDEGNLFTVIRPIKYVLVYRELRGHRVECSLKLPAGKPHNKYI